MSQPKYWSSPAPTACDVTQAPIVNEFIDGRSKQGPWGFFTPSSWAVHGCGQLGMGCGQRYALQDDGRWLKVEG